jgi:uncharacterized protein YjiS (DUF1127 family)
MQPERKSPRIVIANNNHRIPGWEGEPLDLVEALPPFMLKSQPPLTDDDRGGWLKLALSRAISNIMEGFAAYGASMFPEIAHALHEDGPVSGHGKDLLQAQRPDRSILPLARTLDPILPPSSAKERLDRPRQRGGITKHPVDLDEHMPVELVGNNASGWRALLLSMLARPWRSLARAAEMRRMPRTLEALDDRSLRDIGLSRHDIDVVARYGRDWN